MTLAKAESITGYSIVEVDKDLHRRNHTFAACRPDGTYVTSASAIDVGTALSILVERVYSIHGLIVFKAQRLRCAECGQIKPLQRDHIIPRAQGRDDRVSNLRGVCDDCHKIKHRPR